MIGKLVIIACLVASISALTPKESLNQVLAFPSDQDPRLVNCLTILVKYYDQLGQIFTNPNLDTIVFLLITLIGDEATYGCIDFFSGVFGKRSADLILPRISINEFIELIYLLLTGIKKKTYLSNL
jgi:hypothetical protein